MVVPKDLVAINRHLAHLLGSILQVHVQTQQVQHVVVPARLPARTAAKHTGALAVDQIQPRAVQNKRKARTRPRSSTGSRAIVVGRAEDLRRVPEQAKGVLGVVIPDLQRRVELHKGGDRPAHAVLEPVVDALGRHGLLVHGVVQVDDLADLSCVFCMV